MGRVRGLVSRTSSIPGPRSGARPGGGVPPLGRQQGSIGNIAYQRVLEAELRVGIGTCLIEDFLILQTNQLRGDVILSDPGEGGPDPASAIDDLSRGNGSRAAPRSTSSGMSSVTRYWCDIVTMGR